jgi:hypothetical protein
VFFILQAIERQAAAGISEAAALILVVDGQTGVTSSDEEVVSWLRKTHPKKPVSLLSTNRKGLPPSAQCCAIPRHHVLEPAQVCRMNSFTQPSTTDQTAACGDCRRWVFAGGAGSEQVRERS